MKFKNKITLFAAFFIFSSIANAQETISVGVKKVEEFSIAAIILLVLIAIVLIIIIYLLVKHLMKQKAGEIKKDQGISIAEKQEEEEIVPSGKKILKIEEEPEEIEEIKRKIEEKRGQEVEIPSPEFKPSLKKPLEFDETDHFRQDEVLPIIEKHLKEDEKTILNILKMKHGQCSQGTLRVVTGFPKATLSRVLMEMEVRGLIYKEKSGKKNMVYLKNI